MHSHQLNVGFSIVWNPCVLILFSCRLRYVIVTWINWTPYSCEWNDLVLWANIYSIKKWSCHISSCLLMTNSKRVNFRKTDEDTGSHLNANFEILPSGSFIVMQSCISWAMLAFGLLFRRKLVIRALFLIKQVKLLLQQRKWELNGWKIRPWSLKTLLIFICYQTFNFVYSNTLLAILALALGRAKLVNQLTHYFGPHWNNLTTIKWIAITFHVPQKMRPLPQVIPGWHAMEFDTDIHVPP